MEKIVKDIHDLPLLMSLRMAELRNMDRQYQHLADFIRVEEQQLFTELSAVSKGTPGYDEAPFLSKYEALMQLRQELLGLSENQMKKIQHTYDHMDKKIALIGTPFLKLLKYLQIINIFLYFFYFKDVSTKSISHLFPEDTVSSSLFDFFLFSEMLTKQLFAILQLGSTSTDKRKKKKRKVDETVTNSAQEVFYEPVAIDSNEPVYCVCR